MRRYATLLGILMSAALLVILFFRIDLNQFFAAFRSANYYYAILIILVVVAGGILRALRWQWIMLPIKKISVASLFSATVVGYMANSLLPARMGEFVRAHVIGSREGISRASSFATIVVERLFDGLSILLIFAVAPYWIKFPAQKALMAAGLFALFLCILVILVILMFRYKKEKVLDFFNFVFRFLPESSRQKIMKVLGSLADGFKTVEKGHHLYIISFYSFSIWLITALGIYFTAVSFGYHISYASSVFILIVLLFATMLPSSPGFVGTFDAGMAYGLMIFNIPREAALGMAVLYHGLTMLPIIILGLYYMWKDRISLVGF